MATAAAVRSFVRSPSVKTAAARLSGGAKSARSPFCAAPTCRNSLSQRIFRSPVEMSACVGSLQPFHTVTASALMTSMLSLSCRDYSWLSEGI